MPTAQLPLGFLLLCFVRLSCWNTLQICIKHPMPATSLNASSTERVEELKRDLTSNLALPLPSFAVTGKSLSFSGSQFPNLKMKLTISIT